MNPAKKLHAAIDSFQGDVYIAIGREEATDALLIDKRKFNSRNSSGILPWISSALEEKGYSLDDISAWTAGTGPNSFTILRVISSLLSGISYRRGEVSARGVPSACAIAAAAFKKCQADTIHVLFETPEKKIFCQQIDAKDGFSPLDSGIHIDKAIPNRRSSLFAAFKKDRAGVLSFLGKNMADSDLSSGYVDLSAHGVLILLDDYFPVEELMHVMPDFKERISLRDLIYLRPPVDPF